MKIYIYHYNDIIHMLIWYKKNYYNKEQPNNSQWHVSLFSSALQSPTLLPSPIFRSLYPFSYAWLGEYVTSLLRNVIYGAWRNSFRFLGFRLVGKIYSTRWQLGVSLYSHFFFLLMVCIHVFFFFILLFSHLSSPGLRATWK